jgi:ATP-dependent DNA helicase RecQ
VRKTKLLKILKDTFGHQSFRLDQAKIIDSILNGQDTLAIMPTGGGKSACYQVPALYLEGVTIVVSPLISLMYDQVIALKENGVKACFINSNQSYDEQRELKAQIKQGEYKLVYLSPEGLLSHSMLSFLKELDISLIAIDEAHCVSQWGHEFRSDYQKLGALKDLFPTAPLLALTATADQKTRQSIGESLKLANPAVFISSFDRPNIKYSIFERENEIKQLSSFIENNHRSHTGIVYCLSRKKVEKVATQLRELGLDAFPYHAGLSKERREEAQNLFNTQESIIIVATIAFGMGIDRPDVRFVAHLDLPKSIEGYYQETGRAGRDGLPSEAWMIYGLQDVVKLAQMLESTEASEAYKNVARFKLDSMLCLCETPSCKRRYLLDYFNEQRDEDCGNCDSCLNPSETYEATQDAQKLLSTIYRTGQSFGANYVIDVLRGSQNAKVIERGHDKLSVFALGKDRTKQYWSSVTRQILNLGFIAIKNYEYRTFAITAKGGELLKGEHELRLKKQKISIGSAKMNKAIDIDHGRAELFESLRRLRRDLAEEKKVPPYVIFGDKSLHDMCSLLPRNKDEFLLVNGVGRSKLDQYGSSFLKIIQDHL